MMVYRVARHDDPKTGPYNYFDSSSNPLIMTMCIEHADDKHLSPYADDTLDGINAVEHCGLDSLENLYTWFNGFVNGLGKAGFVIYVYESDDARTGQNGQTLFWLDRAELVDLIEMV